MAPQRHRVWRCQRSRPNGDVVSCMTHDRKLALHFTIDHEWHELFGGRHVLRRRHHHQPARRASPQDPA
jgi:hypothetical protein